MENLENNFILNNEQYITQFDNPIDQKYKQNTQSKIHYFKSQYKQFSISSLYIGMQNSGKSYQIYQQIRELQDKQLSKIIWFTDIQPQQQMKYFKENKIDNENITILSSDNFQLDFDNLMIQLNTYLENCYRYTELIKEIKNIDNKQIVKFNQHQMKIYEQKKQFLEENKKYYDKKNYQYVSHFIIFDDLFYNTKILNRIQNLVKIIRHFEINDQQGINICLSIQNTHLIKQYRHIFQVFIIYPNLPISQLEILYLSIKITHFTFKQFLELYNTYVNRNFAYLMINSTYKTNFQTQIDKDKFLILFY